MKTECKTCTITYSKTLISEYKWSRFICIRVAPVYRLYKNTKEDWHEISINEITLSFSEALFEAFCDGRGRTAKAQTTLQNSDIDSLPNI